MDGWMDGCMDVLSSEIGFGGSVSYLSFYPYKKASVKLVSLYRVHTLGSSILLPSKGSVDLG